MKPSRKPHENAAVAKQPTLHEGRASGEGEAVVFQKEDILERKEKKSGQGGGEKLRH